MTRSAERGGSFRPSMAWLHTWGGLWAGWLLFAIFFTGTLGVFDDAITRWMKPEAEALDRPLVEKVDAVQAVDLAEAYLQRVAPASHFWSIGLPGGEDAALRVFWQDANDVFQQARLHPATGAVLPGPRVRETEGGHHFVHMHFEFHAGMAGVWLVGALTVAMLVALLTGIVTHKRIFKDFFTFRPRKGQRSWLDAHNAVAVLTLPFQFMIAYSGLVLFYPTYLPAALAVHYPAPDAFFAELRQEPPHREETGVAAPLTRLSPLLVQAEAVLDRAASFVVVEHPGDSSASVKVWGPVDEGGDESRLLPLEGGHVLFDGVTADVLHVLLPRHASGSAVITLGDALHELHYAEFGGYTVRWLYFLSGMAGAAMMATGSLLFMVKRRQKSLQEFGWHTPRVYRLIDVLNVGAIAGLMLACIAFFWFNRLLPVAMPGRERGEVIGFFLVWMLAFAHAAWRRPPRAWTEQLRTMALLCLALPLLNAVTTGDSVFTYLRAGDSLRAGVELTAVALGLLAAWAAMKVKPPRSPGAAP